MKFQNTSCINFSVLVDILITLKHFINNFLDKNIYHSYQFFHPKMGSM